MGTIDKGGQKIWGKWDDAPSPQENVFQVSFHLFSYFSQIELKLLKNI